MYANSRGPVLRNKVEESILVSPRIETRRGFVQCLRFCINAYTLIKDAKRSLDVWIEYEQEQSSKKTNIFNFTSPLQNWSMYWNYTEINLRGSHNGFYKVSHSKKCLTIQARFISTRVQVVEKPVKGLSHLKDVNFLF